MSTSLFKLPHGARFFNDDEEFELVGFKSERVPRFGKVTVCVTKKLSTGTTSKWMRDWPLVMTSKGLTICADNERLSNS